jgi:hypothetical protein
MYGLRYLPPLICTIMIGGCASSDEDGYESDSSTEVGSSSEDGEEAEAGYSGEEARADFDEDAAREAAEEEIASESYQSIGSPYGCTQDCTGHEAGFAWRRDNGYATPGNSNSFSEGGQAFDEAVDDRADEMRSDYENGAESEY